MISVAFVTGRSASETCETGEQGGLVTFEIGLVSKLNGFEMGLISKGGRANQFN